ncbi:MAG TPA: OsmC family protein [Actinomycetota bacterium]
MSDQLIRWTGQGLQFEAQTTYGMSVKVGGDVEGPGAKPSDLLPVSLAVCTSYDVVTILKKQRQTLVGLEVRIHAEQEREAPWAFISIHQHFVLTGVIDEAKAARAIELSEGRSCSVAATLRPVVRLSHSFEVTTS